MQVKMDALWVNKKPLIKQNMTSYLKSGKEPVHQNLRLN